jgi:LysR family glycine cleavage system transcriptional activator
MFASLPLTALRAFESASRLLSFKAAAEELAVTPTAVSHQIRSLEDLARRAAVRTPATSRCA